MFVSVVGQGTIGTAVRDMLKDHHTVEFNRTEADVAFVCVPTPALEDGSCDVSAVEQSVQSLDADLIVIKSTIAIGTTDRLKAETGKRIVFSGEYRGESSYYNPYFPTDMAEVPFVILGGDGEDTARIQEMLLPVLGPTKTYFRTTARNAEVIKYAENNFFALKITFVNELKRICDAVGADWHHVREGWLLDPRISRMHTMVHPDEPGFGGSCLPKDLSALINSAREAGYAPKLLQEVEDSNKRFRGDDA